MDRKGFVKLIFVFFIMVLVAGCREITVTTTVHADGSCERVVSVRGDSSEILHSRFPVPRDSTWTITQGHEETGEKKYQYRAAKVFARPAAMNPFFDAAGDSLSLHSVTGLKRRFGWFTTFYRYEEIYRAYYPFRHIPLTSYMTEDELKVLYTDKDSTEIKEKYDEWEQKNILEEFLLHFKKAAEKSDDPRLKPDFIRSRKDALYDALFGEGHEDGDTAEQLTSALEEVLGTPSVRGLQEDVERILDEIERKIEFTGAVDSDSYTNNVVMPGIIMDTNADQVAGSGVTWKINPKAFVDADYRMWVESRVVNRWAIGITLLLVLIPAAWAVFRAIKRKSAS